MGPVAGTISRVCVCSPQHTGNSDDPRNIPLPDEILHAFEGHAAN